MDSFLWIVLFSVKRGFTLLSISHNFKYVHKLINNINKVSICELIELLKFIVKKNINFRINFNYLKMI